MLKRAVGSAAMLSLLFAAPAGAAVTVDGLVEYSGSANVWSLGVVDFSTPTVVNRFNSSGQMVTSGNVQSGQPYVSDLAPGRYQAYLINGSSSQEIGVDYTVEFRSGFQGLVASNGFSDTAVNVWGSHSDGPLLQGIGDALSDPTFNPLTVTGEETTLLDLQGAFDSTVPPIDPRRAMEVTGASADRDAVTLVGNTLDFSVTASGPSEEYSLAFATVPTATAVPEPATLALFSLGTLGAGVVTARRRRLAQQAV